MDNRVEAGKVDELGDGEMKVVEAGDRTVLLLNADGELYAIDDECAHQACPLSEGYLKGAVLECSCHGSMYNVKTGEVVQGPAQEGVPTYPVQIDGATVYVSVG